MLRQTVRVYREPFITAIRFNAGELRVAAPAGHPSTRALDFAAVKQRLYRIMRRDEFSRSER